MSDKIYGQKTKVLYWSNKSRIKIQDGWQLTNLTNILYTSITTLYLMLNMYYKEKLERIIINDASNNIWLECYEKKNISFQKPAKYFLAFNYIYPSY